MQRHVSSDPGGRQLNLLNLGPAHTAADAVVHVPDAGVLFTACDAMIALDAPIVVPGRGPVTDPDGIRSVRGYLIHVAEQAEAADTIDLGEYATWLDAEWVVVNVYQRYRELDPDIPKLEVLALLVMQADWLAKHS
jgi:hypothetical protein